jgi:hypothetical protein
LGERSGAPSGLSPSSFVMCNTPVEVQFTSAGCLNYPCRTPALMKYAMIVTIIGSCRIVMFSFGIAQSFALGGNERANFARVSEDHVRAVTHHSSIDKCRCILFGTIAARVCL